MLVVELPVAVSIVPLASAANVFTTQFEGKPSMGTGGPKKQLASNAQLPGTKAQSASLVHATLGACTQWRVAAGPGEQSRGRVPKLAVSVIPSAESRIVVAFSGILDGAVLALPPPM